MNYDVTRKVQEALAERLREAFPDIPSWKGEPMADRDTHFSGFAKLLLEDLGDDIGQLMDETADSGDYEGHMRLIIAQRAYDLVFFLIDEAPTDYSSFNAGYGTPDEIHECIEHLPDLDTWPEPPTTVE